MESITMLFENPIVVVMFSGAGVALVGALIKLIFSRKDSNSQKKLRQKNLELMNDIEQIARLLNHASSYKLQQAYIRYANKYRYQLKEEIELLNQQMTEEKCDYANLLSALLGMLEALLQEESI